jgi:hypothetical protein
VKIPLFDTRKRLQIVLKQLGKEKLTDLAILTDNKLQRFGSVTISLKKLSQGVRKHLYALDQSF